MIGVMKNHGFTLVELMISVGIIGILMAASVFSYGNIRNRANASKVAADLQQIKLGWKVWKSTTDAVYPRENLFPTQNPDYTCFPEPAISQTNVQLYLEDIYRDPWGRQYTYDNEGDTAIPGGGAGLGVNIVIRWCAGEGQRYLEIAPRINAIIDGDGDVAGRLNGLFKWTDNPNVIGGLVFNISSNENQ